MKKNWIWIVLAVIVIALIIWAIVASNKAKAAALQQAAFNTQLSNANPPPTSKLAEILAALFPFYAAYQQSGSGSSTPGGANNEPGTPLGDYCAQYPDSILCKD